MVGLWIFLLFVGIITLPCNSTPDDIDDFSRMSATLSMQNSDSKIQNDRHSRDFESKSPPAAIVPSYLAHFLQQGNNLFFKPQILLGSSLNNPYNSHESDVKEEKEKHENQINLSVNAEPIENDKIIKESDKISKDNEKIPKDDKKIPKEDEKIPKEDEKIPNDDENVSKDDEKISKETDKVIERVEEKSNEKFSDIPEAPILAPLEMPALPQVVVDGSEEIIVDEPENVIIEEIPDSEEVSIEKEHNIVVPEAPQLNPPKIPVQIFIPKPQVPTCIPTFNTNFYQTAVPCFPNYVQPQNSGLTMQDYENILQNKERTRMFPLPRIPLGVTFNRPVKTVMPFRGDVISTTRYLPSVTVSKFPLIKRNRKLLKYPHRRLSQMLLEKVPLRQEKVETFDEPMSSFSAYCAHNIALQRVVPNIVENGDTVNAVPFLELPERPVY